MSTPESRPEGTPEPGDVLASGPDVAAPPAPDVVAAPEPLPVMPEPAADVATDEPAVDPVPDTESHAGPAAQSDDLRAAVGLPAQPERHDTPPRGPRRRIALSLGAIALLAVLVAGLVFLGRQNQRRYYLVCGEDHITAAQGRSFPPWGRSALEGKAWQAIPRPLEALCTDRVFDSREGLARSFAETLVARVDAWVIAREDGAGRERLAEVQAQLDQALRVVRELEAGHPELSGRLQRLRGDLAYWQARDRIDTAMNELARAAQHLDSAVAHEPQHNREQALTWQRALARLRAELGAGPASSAPDAAADPAPPDAAAGTALPAWPGTPVQPGSDPPAVPLDGGPAQAPGSMSDAGPPPAPPALPDTTGPGAPPPPDAGLPRGGLLI